MRRSSKAPLRHRGTRRLRRAELVRRRALEIVAETLRFTTVVIALAIAVLMVRAVSRYSSGQPAELTASFLSPPSTPIASVLLLPFIEAEPKPQDAHTYKVGIVAGHWQYDPGATCPDGTREVDINLAVAKKVVDILAARGYKAELLPELSPIIEGYVADAFVSIHSDSCIWEVSGFKIARVSHSAVPDLEDYLVKCLYETYQEATGMQRHENSITPDMTQYHNFRKIAPGTPGAIIELGFMGSDRDLLLNHQDRLAKGVAEGIIKFLENPLATPTPKVSAGWFDPLDEAQLPEG